MPSDLLWVDPVDRVVSADHSKLLKRHVYRQEGSRLRRVCGSVDQRNSATAHRDELERVEPTEFASDVNACDACLKTTNLQEVADNLQPAGGAETVDCDPFGVFGGDG